MKKKEAVFVADVTMDTEGHVVIEPLGSKNDRLPQKEQNFDGTMFMKPSGAAEFTPEKKAKTRKRLQDVTIKRTTDASLKVSPSGSRVKVYIALDSNKATEENFSHSLGELINGLQDKLISYNRADPS